MAARLLRTPPAGVVSLRGTPIDQKKPWPGGLRPGDPPVGGEDPRGQIPQQPVVKAVGARTAIFFAVVLTFAFPLTSAEVVRRSPRAQTALALEGANIAVDFGRPALRGRVAFGVLVPWGVVWRAGDDEATVFSTDAPLRIGGLLLPPGRYALFVLPEPARAALIFNREPDQWGAFNRDPALDVGAVELESSSIATALENFSLALEPVGAREGRLWLGWEKTVWMTPFAVVAAELAPALPSSSPPPSSPSTPSSPSSPPL